MVLELRVLLHDKVAIIQFDEHNVTKQEICIQTYYLYLNLIILTNGIN
jgi:hypothetical protein